MSVMNGGKKGLLPKWPDTNMAHCVRSASLLKTL